ncbi:MAG: hypothetical protein AB2541_02815 [Candidatus Thiodiazotropha sp.]
MNNERPEILDRLIEAENAYAKVIQELISEHKDVADRYFKVTLDSEKYAEWESFVSQRVEDVPVKVSWQVREIDYEI